ncbi:MAG: flagellar basal body rod protein FlgB [Desulfobulbaceae bacterium]|nr:flagellar basal body rod protein FlgB [Desulfobulbaceae bacterium]MCK5436464.1 flagellar basal body rod protein FlgB [Desulfobulbaceae bacterium]MCK5545292.1 flagellar basal body rod protein FlgB [Desulfobulbaceae bacterium]
MPINNLFGGLINKTAYALDLRNERQGLIQSNVANLETPGYNVQEFPFSRVLERMTTSRGQLDRTHPKHIALDPVDVGKSLEFTEEARPVDLDEEMVKLAENQLMYQVGTQIIAKKLSGLKWAIDEGGK